MNQIIDELTNSNVDKISTKLINKCKSITDVQQLASLLLNEAIKNPERAHCIANLCKKIGDYFWSINGKPPHTNYIKSFNQHLLGMCQTHFKQIGNNEEAKDFLMFIGEMYRVKLLTDSIITDCLMELLDNKIVCFMALLERVGPNLPRSIRDSIQQKIEDIKSSLPEHPITHELIQHKLQVIWLSCSGWQLLDQNFFKNNTNVNSSYNNANNSKESARDEDETSKCREAGETFTAILTQALAIGKKKFDAISIINLIPTIPHLNTTLIIETIMEFSMKEGCSSKLAIFTSLLANKSSDFKQDFQFALQHCVSSLKTIKEKTDHYFIRFITHYYKRTGFDWIVWRDITFTILQTEYTWHLGRLLQKIVKLGKNSDVYMLHLDNHLSNNLCHDQYYVDVTSILQNENKSGSLNQEYLENRPKHNTSAVYNNDHKPEAKPTVDSIASLDVFSQEIELLSIDELNRICTKLKMMRARVKDIIQAKKQEEQRCVVCLENTKTMAFIKCGHFCLCDMCGNKIKANSGACPLCRVASDIVKLY
jgi:hypothetical protein